MLGEDTMMAEGIEVRSDLGTPIPIAAAREIFKKQRARSNETVTFEMLQMLFDSYGAQGAFYVLGLADHA